MSKVKYIGAYGSYTVAGIAFKKGEAIELADDQIAKIKANGVGSKLFANGNFVVDKAKAVVNPDSTPKATDKTDKATK